MKHNFGSLLRIEYLMGAKNYIINIHGAGFNP
jgi:hypothetical protein